MVIAQLQLMCILLLYIYEKLNASRSILYTCIFMKKSVLEAIYIGIRL